MKIGLIGSSGFIGRNLRLLLNNNPKVTIIDWNRDKHGNFLILNDRNSFLNQYTFDMIYQLSWTNINDSNYRLNMNNKLFADATLDFVYRCIEREIRIVAIGTHQDSELSESDIYLSSKEFLLKSILDMNSNLVSLIRPTFVFSIEDRRPHLFRSFIRWLETGNDINTFSIKSPEKMLDLIHVCDVANALAEFSRSFNFGNFYTLASGYSISVENAIKFLNDFINHSETYVLQSKITYSEFASEQNVIISNEYTKRFFNIEENQSIKF